MRSSFKPVLAGLVLLGTVASAGPAPPPIARVLDALSRDLPMSAIPPLDSIRIDAEARHDWPAAVHALALRVALESATDGDATEGRIRRMTAAIASAPPPMRPVLELVLARWMAQYLDMNRWRIDRRTTVAAVVDTDLTTWDASRLYDATVEHFGNALAGQTGLLGMRAAEWATMFPGGTAPEAYRPTAFDLVANEVTEFLASHERPGERPEHAFELNAEGPALAPRERFLVWAIDTPDTASAVARALGVYQVLLAAHRLDVDRTALIDADLWRLQFAYAHATGEGRDARYLAALEHLATADSTHELSTRALHAIAEMHRNQDDIPGAHAIALRGAARFPSSVGARRCRNLIAAIESPSLGLESSDEVWNTPAPSVRVQYCNLERVYFRLYRMQGPPHGDDDWEWRRKALRACCDAVRSGTGGSTCRRRPTGARARSTCPFRPECHVAAGVWRRAGVRTSRAATTSCRWRSSRCRTSRSCCVVGDRRGPATPTVKASYSMP